MSDTLAAARRDAAVAGSETVLDVRDLRVAYHGRRATVHALDGVSFDVRRGEIFGIVGESGSGKSTAIRAIIRLLPRPGAEVLGGEVRFGGQDLLGLSESAMQRVRGSRIAMVFQDPFSSLNPVLTVEQQIGEGLLARPGHSRREVHARVLDVMRLVGIPDAERRLRAYPHELSGGLRQRVAIATALVGSPELLLADEPTTALDVTIQDQILRLLTDLRDQLGMAVVLVTHDLGIVAQTCQRMAVMYAGRIVEIGSVVDLYRQPSHPYTRALLASLPRIGRPREPLEAIPGAPPELDQLPVGCRFAERCSFAVERCRQVDPVLEEHRPGQRTACIRHRELFGLADG